MKSDGKMILLHQELMIIVLRTNDFSIVVKSEVFYSKHQRRCLITSNGVHLIAVEWSRVHVSIYFVSIRIYVRPILGALFQKRYCKLMDKMMFIVRLWMEFLDKWEQSYFVEWKFPANFLNKNESIYVSVVPSIK